MTAASDPSRSGGVVLQSLPLLLLLVVLATFGALSSRFMTADNLAAILTQSSGLIVVALGANLVLLTGGVDLSAGSVIYLAAVIAGLGFANASWILALAVAVVTGLLFGAINAMLVVGAGVPGFIVTLATAYIGRGLGLLLSSSKMVLAGPAMATLGRGSGLWSSSTLMAGGAILSVGIMLYRTPFGRHLFAVGANAQGARRVGIPTARVSAGAYAVSAMLASLGGFIFFSQASAASPSFGQNKEFLAIAAAVLGGTRLSGGQGSLGAPLLGALLITSVQNGLTIINANPYAYPVFTGAVIFLAGFVDSLRRRTQAPRARGRR